MSAPVTYAQRRDNCRAWMGNAAAAATRDNLVRLARQYEASYRRARTSKRPPAPHLLRGMVETARAFYSLARAVR